MGNEYERDSPPKRIPSSMALVHTYFGIFFCGSSSKVKYLLESPSDPVNMLEIVLIDDVVVHVAAIALGIVIVLELHDVSVKRYTFLTSRKTCQATMHRTTSPDIAIQPMRMSAHFMAPS